MKIYSMFKSIFFYTTIVALLVFNSSIYAGSENMKSNDCMEKLIESYIDKTKGWSSEEYTVKFNRYEDNALVYWVILKSEESSTMTVGGGNSVEVHVDKDTKEVLRELRFQ